MAENGSGGSSVNIVAILAIVVLVGLVAWFIMGPRSQKAPTSPPAATAPAGEKEADVKIEVDLPDSVTIKP